MDFITDLIFIIVYAIEMVIYMILTTSGLYRRPETRTIFNVVLSASIYMCLFTHITCLMCSELNGNKDFKIFSIEYYLYYQLTFDLLNFALIANIF